VTAPAILAPPIASGANAGTLQERFSAGQTFSDFLSHAVANAELWRAVYAHARVDDAALARAASLGGPWHLLVLVEDWCGDGVNTIPVLGRLAEHAPNIDLRILGRDANLDLMDAHLTNKSRSIPVVMILDPTYRERAWWGPRPAELQAWIMGPGRTMTKEDRYREVRRWYARDHGATTVNEVLSLIAAAPEGTGAPVTIARAQDGTAGGPSAGPGQA
jgi:thioredoxin family protein